MEKKVKWKRNESGKQAYEPNTHAHTGDLRVSIVKQAIWN